VCVCARARACERAKVMAEDYEEVATLEAGDIGAVAGLKRTTRNPKP
jgi:translation elongation factor EF-G